MTDIFHMGGDEREGVMLAQTIYDALLRLDMFSVRAAVAVKVFERLAEDLCDGGLEDRDVFLVSLLRGLADHLKMLHKL